MLFSPLLLSILEVRGMCHVVLIHHQMDASGHPLVKKRFLSTGWRKEMPVGRSDFSFFPNIFFPFLVGGGVLQFFGNTVICLMCPINRFSDHRWRKERGRNLYLSKNYLEKKICEKKKKSPPDLIGKKVPVGRFTGNNLLFEDGLRATG